MLAICKVVLMMNTLTVGYLVVGVVWWGERLDIVTKWLDRGAVWCYPYRTR